MEIGALEVIRTLRSMRRLKPDPVEPKKLRMILEAAGKAPSGGNTQPWEFIVITDPVVKKKLRDLTVRGLKIYAENNLLIPKHALSSFLNSKNPVTRMAENTDRVPVLVVVCLNVQRAKRLTSEWAWLEEQANWASIFPAMQNMLLAARAIGLGTAISIFPLFVLKELKELLKLPGYVKPAIVVYVGYPAARFAEPKRHPIENFLHENTW